jgi:nitroimidazol reductase NimA-like FMN-containing flavoprotein (pyridoxamine 5'-phosphate oxidase superfamily)
MHELDLPTCERLLRRGAFGRLGLVTPRGPEIVPVNYVAHEDAVLVRTTPEGLPARYGAGAAVVFEVDAVDHTAWRGFSVVARGVGELLDELPEEAPVAPRPWATGERDRVLRIVWTELTGRSVGAPTRLESLLPVGRVLA